MTAPYLKNAAEGVLSLEPYAPGMPVEELQRRLGIAEAIKLASNENPLGPSPRVKDALGAFLQRSSLALYPDGGGFRLKRRLSEFLGVGQERITLGNGSNDLIELLGRVFLGPGRSAMFSAHAFAVYPIITQAQSARAVVVPARPLHDAQPYGHDLEAFAHALAQHRDVSLIFIANPNNPTGTWLEPDALERFLQQVPPHVVVALDEAYDEFMAPELRGRSIAWLERFPNLVIFRTFSKAYGLAGLRVGYALSSRELADLMNRVRQPFNNNSLALLAAEVALDDQDHVQRVVELNTRERARLSDCLRGLGLSVLPSQANFLAIGFGRDAQPIHQALLERGVILRPIASYALPQFLRVSVGTESENDRFLAALREVLAQ